MRHILTIKDGRVALPPGRSFPNPVGFSFTGKPPQFGEMGSWRAPVVKDRWWGVSEKYSEWIPESCGILYEVSYPFSHFSLLLQSGYRTRFSLLHPARIVPPGGPLDNLFRQPFLAKIPPNKTPKLWSEHHPMTLNRAFFWLPNEKLPQELLFWTSPIFFAILIITYPFPTDSS